MENENHLVNSPFSILNYCKQKENRFRGSLCSFRVKPLTDNLKQLIDTLIASLEVQPAEQRLECSRVAYSATEADFGTDFGFALRP